MARLFRALRSPRGPSSCQESTSLRENRWRHEAQTGKAGDAFEARPGEEAQRCSRAQSGIVPLLLSSFLEVLH
jgi:hypothetical protein